MKFLYLDCSAGIAGDMLLASLIDLGASVDEIKRGLGALRLGEPWELEIEETERRGIAAKRAVVTVKGRPADEAHDHHDHDGHQHQHDHGHSHDNSGHSHAHERDHGHAHPHRPYREIKRLLADAELPPRVKARAQDVFRELARAEGAVHGVSPDDVHFHEVGSTDAIIDVVGCCLALEFLGVDTLEASPLHVGRGFVNAAHGRLPIPAPATARLVEGMQVYQTDVFGELVTPTGAALVRGLCRRVGSMPLVTVQRIGWGAGTKDFTIPNVLRAYLVVQEGTDGFVRDHVLQLSANIDDMSPQLFGALFEHLFALGVKDVWVEAATMKKSRPGHVLHVLTDQAHEAEAVACILRETTTLGVRVSPMYRHTLTREWVEVTTKFGRVRVKVGRRGDDVWNVAPEYDDCLAAAHAAKAPLRAVMDEALACARRELGETS